MNLERQKENFKNHIATFTDYGNIKILDFKNPESSHYRIRFLFEEEYYRTVFSTLGSEAEEMYERDYDMVDILEREEFEKWLGQKSDLLEKLCEERGIKLWEDYYGK